MLKATLFLKTFQKNRNNIEVIEFPNNIIVDFGRNNVEFRPH